MSELEAFLASLDAATRGPFQTFARGLQELEIKWQEIEDGYSRQRDEAATPDDQIAAAISRAYARGAREAVGDVSRAMFKVLAGFGS